MNAVQNVPIKLVKLSGALVCALWSLGSHTQATTAAVSPTALPAVQSYSSAHFRLQLRDPQDRALVTPTLKALELGFSQLKKQGLTLPSPIWVQVYGNLSQFKQATAQPWYVLALAQPDLKTIHLQRLQVVQRFGLKETLWHELYHLAQPKHLLRWQAEHYAMHFAGQVPRAQPLAIDPQTLDKQLANPKNADYFLQLMATAYYLQPNSR